MSFNGAAVYVLTKELRNKLTGGRISKVVQTQSCEVFLHIKTERETLRLLISANPALPVIYITDERVSAPLSAPSFCMLLRKHIQGGKITCISQPSLERIVNLEIEHYNELGDLCTKTLTAELMGKHSNIILREGSLILDSIKHVNSLMSSVREVLPHKEYFIPHSGEKIDPLAFKEPGFEKTFYETVFSENSYPCKALLKITGFSPDISEEILYNAHVDSLKKNFDLTEAEKNSIYDAFIDFMQKLSTEGLVGEIVYENELPLSFSPFHFNINAHLHAVKYDSFSALLKDFYFQKQSSALIRQKTATLRQLSKTLLERANKKYDIQLKQLKGTEKMDKYRLYGELVLSNAYNIRAGATTCTCLNYYTNEEVTIALDPVLSAIENSNKFYERYNKLKRTKEQLSEIIVQTKDEIDYLDSILISLDNVKSEEDISDIKKEMLDAGFIRGRSSFKNSKKGNKRALKSKPLHFLSSDGFDIYVGKNNLQNEYITFELANGGDWWFHAKKIPGSHVIVKTGGRELPDKTFEEAAKLAAYYSKAKESGICEIDYIQRKHVKKVPNTKPGFVIYHTNYSMNAKTDISDIKQVE